MKRLRALGLILLFATPALAQSDPPSTAAEETDAAVLAVIGGLKSDAALVDSVAARVARSRLIGQITQDLDPAARLAAAKSWIAKDPAAAAHVALGLADDDRRGRPSYEDALLKQMATAYGANPGAEKNLFHILRKNAKNSRLLKKQSEEVSADEQREILRTLFEGKGAQSERTLNMKADGKAATANKPDKPATAFNGFYDRLNAGNLRGYSPQLMALQSALNARRPPGAPALIETGKLDYATLSYPAYAMSYDVGNLDARLRADRIAALARGARRTVSAQDWGDPNLEATLAASAPANALSPRLKRRAELAAKARTALASFQNAAAKAKDPRAISRALLIELGEKQKEAARWIAAAALEEELSRLEPLERFLAPELLAAIDAVPVSAAQRDAYKRRGSALETTVRRARAAAEKALDLLESAEWAKNMAAADRLIVENQGLKRHLGRDIDNFSRVPFRIAAARTKQPRWRKLLDDLAVQWLPRLSYSRAVARRREEFSRLLSIFNLIAAGAADEAHARLAAP